MQRSPIVARAFAALAALALVASPTLAQPKQGKKGKEKEAPAQQAPAEAPTTKKPIVLVPEGLKWGMGRADLEKMVERFIDDDYRPKYKAAGASRQKVKDLDAEVNEKKAGFRRSFIDLVPGPVGLDASPIAVEYTKGNNEALMSHHRGPGVKIWFFFIGGRLWKTVEEVNLIEGGLYGKDMDEALNKKLLGSVGGTMPRITPADPDKGSFYTVFDWQDATTHMRGFDRSGVLVIAREDKATLAQLPNLRSNVQKANDGVDPSIASVLREPGKDEKKEEKKEEKKDDKSKGKK